MGVLLLGYASNLISDDEAVSKGQRRRLVVAAIGLRIDQETWMTLIEDVDKLPANVGRMVF